MSFSYSPKIVTEGLVFCVDAANPKSYIGSGTAWNDLKGGNNGTLVNSPTYDSSNGGSLLFNGSDEYTIVNTSTNFNATTQISIDTWIKVTQTGQRSIVSNFNVDAPYIGWELGYGVLANDIVDFYIGEYAGGSSFMQVGTTPVNNGVWNNICVSWNGSSATFYVNSVLQGSVVKPNVVNGNSSNNLYIGRDSNASPQRLFNGNISSVKIYNRALSATEVLQNYNATKGRFGL